MRSALRLTLVLLVLPAVAAAKDVYLHIAGSVNEFRTDTRIFNPSGTKDITVTAAFLRAGQDNTNPTTRMIAISKRQMFVSNDVVADLFSTTGLGAIRLSSPDDFVATSRIYAQTASGTLGQFVVGLEPSAAKTKGILIQLKANGFAGQQGTFRTNLGFVNPNSAAATITIRRYNKSNAVVGNPIVQTIPPFSVVFPVTIDPAAGDFTDAWVDYESTQPILGFGSVIDNLTTDPTFIPAFEDTGTTPAPQPTVKTFNVTARQFQFDVAEGPIRVEQGDRVVIRVTSADVVHGFAIVRYAPLGVTATPGSTQTIEFVADQPGNFEYFCTVTTCGDGHVTMFATMVVTPKS